MSETKVKLRAVDAPSLRERVSREEWEMRCDLAAAYQLAALHRWTDLIYTHFSARVPGSSHLLINPYGLMFDEITASTLVKIDKDGNVVDDPTGLGINRAGEARVSPWTTCIDSAMVDDDHGAVERVADGIGGTDIARHVLVVGLRASK